ncbi:hypothetical protein PENSPDRAFT_680188 [Peniophora sp. CONT]|nr:hypothetical protein PENSPDRAFT_680188 [Peniophora sp. CONT]
MADPSSPIKLPEVKSKPPLTLTLHQAQLVFIPIDGFRTCFVTSLWVHTTGPTPTQEESEVYKEYQDEISILLLKLATRHLQAPFAEGTFPCTIEGTVYKLHVVTRPWALGPSLGLGWGKVPVKAAAEKWQVHFEVA